MITLGPIYTHEKREFLNYFSYDPSTQESEIFFKEPYDTSVCMVEQQENLSITSEGYP